jgi:cytochrome c553
MDCLLLGCLSPLSLARILSTGRLGSHATPEHAQKPARPRRLLLTWLLSGAWLLTGLAGSVAASETVEYNRDIRPILAEHCFACHGADAEARQADLRLDQREALIDSGVITPGDPADSALIDRVFTDDPELMMPPAETKKPLSLEQRELLKRWVEDGAEYQSHWAFQPPRKRNPPTVQNEAWVKNDIDRFILARLEQSGLTPAPEADARTLFRRIHLDITGLPPDPGQLNDFLRDYPAGGDEALSVWVDRLMNAPAWGEHRARYWLDAARYADTHGMHFDNYREMWPYRDWVIRAFNANQAFDQFTVEQLAGDLLPNPTDDQLIATGFQRCNITTNEGGTIEAENLANYAVDRVQTFGWVYLGLTTNCAQCHDHKFDPISQKDFYSLAAFFRNTTQKGLDGNVKDGRSAVLLVPSMEDQPRWQALPAEIEAAIAEREQHKAQSGPEFEKWLTAVTPESFENELPRNSLVAHFPMTEAAGNAIVNELSPQTSYSATGEVAWIVDGKLGPAPTVKAGATFELGELGNYERDKAFSFGAWIKAANKTSSGSVLARMDSGAAYRGWDLYQGGGRLAIHLVDTWPGNALKVATAREVLDPAQWQHVFVTYDGTGKPEGIKLYLNGHSESLKIETKTLTAEASIVTQTPLRIGQRSGGDVFEGGAVQDVYLFDRMLSADEVAALAESGPLKRLLSIASSDRTPEQQQSLQQHYLQTVDAPYQQLAHKVTQLEAEREAIQGRSPVTHIQQEKADSPAMAHILMRGEYDQLGEQVLADTPAALHPLPAEAPHNRLGLAQWVVAAENPLTARVTVNRFWQQLFGQGFVASAEDFGVMGSVPSHPDLLDWLAVDFREHGWDVKRFYKQMLMSATYRQAAVAAPDKLEKDSNNLLLSRGPRFRMDAEMVRDYALASSGLLSSMMYGPSVKPYQPSKIWDMVGLPGGDTRDYVQDQGVGSYRRALYTFWKRMAPPPNLEAFNAPSREVCTVRRERTNTPLQALVTLNDPQFVEAALKLAERAIRVGSGNSDKVIDEIAARVLARPLSDRERSILVHSHIDLLDYYRAQPEDAQALIGVSQAPIDPKIPAADLAAWTMVCNQVMNLDETLCK